MNEYTWLLSVNRDTQTERYDRNVDAVSSTSSVVFSTWLDKPTADCECVISPATSYITSIA